MHGLFYNMNSILFAESLYFITFTSLPQINEVLYYYSSSNGGNNFPEVHILNLHIRH